MAAILCKRMGECLRSLGRCLATPFASCFYGIAPALISPLVHYVVITIACSVPPLYWSIETLHLIMAANFWNQCQYVYWMFINGGFVVIHVLFSAYIATRVHGINRHLGAPEDFGIEDTGYQSMEGKVESGKAESASTMKLPNATAQFWEDQEGADPQAIRPTRANSWKRWTQVFCYDGGVAAYIFFGLGWVIWQVVGVTHIIFDGMSDDDVCGQIDQWTVSSLLCGFFYVMLVGIVVGCAMLCMRY